jgi:hypothetical protein
MQWWMRPDPAPLRNLEAPALAQQHVLCRDADVIQRDLHVPVRRVVIAVDGERALHGDARRVQRHQHHGLLRMLGGARVRLAHDDGDLAPGIARTRRPPLGAVDDVRVAVPRDLRLDVGRVRRGDTRLRHQEGRPDLAAHQGRQPLLLLTPSAVAVEHLHVAGVGAEQLNTSDDQPMCPISSAHSAYSRLVSCVPSNAKRLVDMLQRAARRHEQVPQASFSRARLQVLDQPQRLPAIAVPISR